jgi:hypothetical protein
MGLMRIRSAMNARRRSKVADGGMGTQPQWPVLAAGVFGDD